MLLRITTACLSTLIYMAKRLAFKGMARKHAGITRVFRRQLGRAV